MNIIVERPSSDGNFRTIEIKDITKRGDPRITRVGKLLRQSKINELPQLINILTGDMSFVGPRPLMKVGFDRYTDDLKSKVYNVIPGLTGIGSIVFRDEELIITQSKLPPQETYRTIIFTGKTEWVIRIRFSRSGSLLRC